VLMNAYILILLLQRIRRRVYRFFMTECLLYWSPSQTSLRNGLIRMKVGQWSSLTCSNHMKGNCYGIVFAMMRTDFSYPVKKEVGKVGEDSPLFIVPLDSAENKSSIANFFAKSPTKSKVTAEKAVDKNAGVDIKPETRAPGKRNVDEMAQEMDQKEEESSPQKVKIIKDEMKGQSPIKTAQRTPIKRAKPPVKKSPLKKEAGSKITNFFSMK
jgi:hypothetical protein